MHEVFAEYVAECLVGSLLDRSGSEGSARLIT